MTVGDLFAKIIRRLPDFSQEMDFLSAIQLSVDIAARILREARSDLLKTDFTIVVAAAVPYSRLSTYNTGDRCLYDNREWKAVQSITVPEEWNRSHWAPNLASFDLDPNFRGFAGFPWISDPMQKRLFPLPEIQMKGLYKLPGMPDYYELRHLTVRLFPTPDADVTINGEIYANPAALVDMTSTLPFYGLLDQALTEAVMMIGKNGLSITVDPSFREFMRDQIALVHHLRPAKSIFWNPPPTGRCRQWLV
jgi:hypothetical protein